MILLSTWFTWDNDSCDIYLVEQLDSSVIWVHKVKENSCQSGLGSIVWQNRQLWAYICSLVTHCVINCVVSHSNWCPHCILGYLIWLVLVVLVLLHWCLSDLTLTFSSRMAQLMLPIFNLFRNRFLTHMPSSTSCFCFSWRPFSLSASCHYSAIIYGSWGRTEPQ